MSFFEAQRRHRRASRRWSVLAAVAVALSGIPLSLFLAPALYAVILTVAYLASAVLPLDPGRWRALHDVALLLPAAWSALRHGGAAVPWEWVIVAAVLPGALAMLLVWAGLRVLFRRVGAGGILRRLGTREPDPARPEERRLVNLVHEMAIAAGVPPPRVVLVDSPAANAAAVGLTTDDATIVVSRGLLDALDRGEAQAVIAHLVASVGNGDLRLAALILSVLQAWGFLLLLFDAPFGGRARRVLRRIADAAIAAWRGTLDQREGELVTDLLLDSAGFAESDLDRFLREDDVVAHSLRRNLLVDLPSLLTFGIASIGSKLAVWTSTLLVFGPFIARLWRERRRLADAGAVQLTRNPEALAGALRALAVREVEIPGAAPVHFLFPVWPRSTASATASATDRTDVASLLLRMHVDHEERLARVRALGAQLAEGDDPRAVSGVRERAGAALEAARDLARLLPWLGVAVLTGLVLLAINFAVTAALLMAVWWVLDLLLVRLPGWFGGMIVGSP